MSVLAHKTITVDQLPAREITAGQLLLLHNVSWSSYVAIGRALQDRPAIRMTYDEGELEIMTTSPQHEFYKKYLSRFVETLAEEFEVKIATAGEMTFQRKDLEKGFEGDDCFWIAHELQMRGKMAWRAYVDPPPDLFLEIEVSRRALKRMKLFAALRIAEVWCCNGREIRVHLLQDDGTYRQVESSPTFPRVPLQGLVRFLQPDKDKDYLTVIRELRDWIGKLKARPRSARAKRPKR